MEQLIILKRHCGEKMKWRITEQHKGLFIKDYLRSVHHFSHRIIKAIKFDGGQIKVNGEEQKVNYRLLESDLLTITFPPEKKGNLMYPEDSPLSVIYEDEDILIINKQPGQVTMPSNIHPSGTLANAILGYYKQNNIPYTVHIVTRLDRDTSGLVLIAKHRYSHSLLATAQTEGNIKRKYKAIVEGTLQKTTGIIDRPIGRKEGSIIERVIAKDGQKAITYYEVEEEVNNHSLVDVNLMTGRTHQIRVHFSSMNHPLAGDDLYGGVKEMINRQALHCYKIKLDHPITKSPISIQLDMPQDMLSILK